MKKENIRKIGIEKGVQQLDLFIEFLSKRFPNESDRITSYFSEWAGRFNTGSPENYMDNESKEIYYKVKGELEYEEQKIRKFECDSMTWDDGELPKCSFCGKNIDEVDGLYDTPFSGELVCGDKDCRAQLLEECLNSEVDEVTEE